MNYYVSNEMAQSGSCFGYFGISFKLWTEPFQKVGRSSRYKNCEMIWSHLNLQKTTNYIFLSCPWVSYTLNSLIVPEYRFKD